MDEWDVHEGRYSAPPFRDCRQVSSICY
jgi:hypothetical protein